MSNRPEQPQFDLTAPGPHANRERPTPACNCRDCRRLRRAAKTTKGNRS